MHELLHFIGLCPDSITHNSLIETMVTNYQTIHDLLNLNLKNYVTKFTSSGAASTN
jgi:hypothetical protein